MSDMTEMQDSEFPSRRQFTWLVLVLLAYFGARLLFFAASISPVVPPDEATNLGKCLVFSKVALLPENSAESYQYGLVTNIPWLYFWIMGKVLHLNFFGISDLLFLRLFNIPIAFGTVYFVWRLLRLLTDDRLTQILLVVAMTNTIMFSFLSAFVSYDNLTNLLAAMAVYYLFAFFKNRSGTHLAASLLCQLAGCLTKITFLPLVLVLNVLLFLHEFRNLPQLFSMLRSRSQLTGGRAPVILAVALLLCLSLNVQLYGGNYLHYGGPLPAMSAVLPVEQVMQYRLEARSYIFDSFKKGSISKEKALELTGQIKNPGDREDAVYLIENWAVMKINGVPMMGLMEYLPIWVTQMAAGVFGIFAHLAMPNHGPTMLPFALLAVLSLLAFLVRWRPREEGWSPFSLAAVALFYGYILMSVVNYRDYLESGVLDFALQGRYIFPVIGPSYVLGSLYLLRLFEGTAARLAVFILTALIFLASDFPYFLAHVTPEWFVLTN